MAVDGQQPVLVADDVGGEQPTRAQPAGVVERGRARQPARRPRPGRRRSPARWRRRRAGRTPAAVGERCLDAAERRDLDHENVGRLAQPGYVRRVGGLADALVGGDRHVDAAAHLGLLGQRRARLLGVLQCTAPPAAAASAGSASTACVDGPGAVGVDPDPTVRHRASASAAATATTRATSSASEPPGSATFTLAVRQPPLARTRRAASLGPDRRDDRVDRDRARARGGRPRTPAGLDRGGEPARGLGRRVLDERARTRPSRTGRRAAPASRSATPRNRVDQRQRVRRAHVPAARPARRVLEHGDGRCAQGRLGNWAKSGRRRCW